MARDEQQDRFEERLERVARDWQALRYTGPAPSLAAEPTSSPLAWAGAFAVAVLLVFIAWPSAPDWPDDLRPVVRGSPFEVAAPSAPDNGIGFRYPGRPARSTCFSQTDNCDQPAG